MLPVIVIAAVVFLIQGILSAMQMKNLSNEYLALRRKGKVAFGRKSGGFHAGAIVMFRIDDEGIVQEAKVLEGVSVLARVKPLEGFQGRYVGELTEEDGPRNHRNLRKAIADAALTYRKYTAGELVDAPPSPAQKMGMALTSVGRNLRQKRIERT
jgi:DNA-binding transcriptional regulator of glucitol operon